MTAKTLCSLALMTIMSLSAIAVADLPPWPRPKPPVTLPTTQPGNPARNPTGVMAGTALAVALAGAGLWLARSGKRGH